MENIANRSQKWLTAATHTHPLVFETSEPEGIPETLPIYIAPCISAECDAGTCNMFSFLRSFLCSVLRVKSRLCDGGNTNGNHQLQARPGR